MKSPFIGMESWSAKPPRVALVTGLANRFVWGLSRPLPPTTETIWNQEPSRLMWPEFDTRRPLTCVRYTTPRVNACEASFKRIRLYARLCIVGNTPSLACWGLRRLNSASPRLAIPSNPSSRPPCEAGSRSVSSRFYCRSNRTEATLFRSNRSFRDVIASVA